MINRRSIIALLAALPFAKSIPALADTSPLLSAIRRADKKLAAMAAQFEGHFVEVWSCEKFSQAALPREWPFHRGPTGEPFVVIASGGGKPEGEPFPQWYDHEDEAIGAWAKSVRDYANGKGRCLYWRQAPEMTIGYGGSSVPRLSVYARLLVSDKPLADEFLRSPQELRSLHDRAFVPSRVDSQSRAIG